MSLEDALLDRLRSHLLDNSLNEAAALSSIRLNVLSEAARILQIPFDPHDHCSDRLILSPETFRALDEAWFRINGTFSDNRITHQEKTIRDQFFFHAPHYADRTRLFQFLNILVKRDSVSDNTTTKTTLLYQILAVDGFRGILPSQLRNYTNHLSDRLPPMDRLHVKATRALYSAVSFSGSIAAGLVLLSLLRLYLKRVGIRTDRTTRQVAERTIECVSEFVSSDCQKMVLKKLIKIYRKHVSDNTILDAIAFRKLIDYGKAPKYL